jgi:hypothetical protein
MFWWDSFLEEQVVWCCSSSREENKSLMMSISVLVYWSYQAYLRASSRLHRLFVSSSHVFWRRIEGQCQHLKTAASFEN